MTMKLPEDLVYEIFSWLPAKSILKFKSCSKFIYEFTKEKKFVMKHSQNVTLRGDSSFFIQGGIKAGIYGNKASSSCTPKHFLKLLNKGPLRILSSGRGLLLCELHPKGGCLFGQNLKGELIICNPTTQSFSYVVAPSNFEEFFCNKYMTLAFGSVHDEEYQVLVFEHHQEQESEYIVCKAYKPKEGVWKERPKGLLMGYRWALLCSYSSRGRCQNMLSYNFESGEMRRVLLLKEAAKTSWFDLNMLHYHGLRLFKRDKAVGTSSDDICLVIWDKDDLVFTLWVLIDYESSCWSKFLTVSMEEMGLGKNDSNVRGYAVMNGNCLVFTTRKNVYRYDLIVEKGTRLEKIGWHTLDWGLNIFSYSSTLLSCGPNA